MSGHVIAPPAVVAAPIHGSHQTFPVRRVYCIGRNYAAHAIEMGHDPDREPPFFFQKNPDNLDFSGAFPYPDKTSDVHHEVELVAALSKGGRNIPVERAMACVWGYGVGLDMTRRDLQAEAKKLGRPWEVAKAFERSAPMGRLVPAGDIAEPRRGKVLLKVNGALRQEGDLNQLIWKIPEIIAYLSEYFELAPGDVVMTGTPSGVGPVARGDVIEASIEGVDAITVRVV